MEKYEYTGETKKYRDVTLHRIRAIKDFGDVKAGDLGGWIESESNLCDCGSAWVYDSAIVCESAIVGDSAIVCGSAKVFGSAMVYDSAKVGDSAWVYDSAWVCDSARVGGSTIVRGSAQVESDCDYITVGPIGSRNDYTTFYRDSSNNICVACGCFTGTIDEFYAAVKNKHGYNEHARAYLAAINLAKTRILQID